MMKKVIIVMIACVMLLGAGKAMAFTITGTFVDADTTNTGPASAWTVTGEDTDTDNKWTLRDNSYDPSGLFSPGYVSSYNNQNGTNEDCPMITTTVSGLASGEYDVWMLWWPWQLDPDYMVADIKAALTGETLVSYGVTDGDDTGYINHTGVDRRLRQVYLGQTVTTTSIGVDIDDSPTQTAGTMYEGIAYQLIPEPVTLSLLTIGALALLVHRRRK